MNIVQYERLQIYVLLPVPIFTLGTPASSRSSSLGRVGRDLDIPYYTRTPSLSQFLLITQMVPSETSTHIQLLH
jgi:hypothetical protein